MGMIIPKPEPRDEPMHIDRLYAFVATDEEGDEGLTGFLTKDGWMPMVAADEARVESLRDMAQRIATEYKQSISLVEFSTRIEKEVFSPE